MTRSETAKLVAMLLQAYPAAQFGPSSSSLYETALADIAADDAFGAVRRLIATAKWFPTVAEIRSMAVEIRLGARRLGAEAYGDVLAAVRARGAYRRPPEFKDALVGECVALMGWRSLCLGENEASDRARFIELYEGLQERGRVDAVAGRSLPARAVGFKLRGVPRGRLAKGTTSAEIQRRLAEGKESK